MEENNVEKVNPVLSYFEENDIVLPDEVISAIKDVFAENDEISNVDVYYKPDVDTLLEEVSFRDFVKVDVSGKCVGSRHNMFTYFGNIAFDENIITTVNKGDDVLEVIEDVQSVFSSDEKVCNVVNFDPEGYVVLLIEHVNWETPCDDVEREASLVVYCPLEIESEDV